ncbi:MAG: CBS domain-containing protein, partial [Planctomycetaceae bacterium]|nr:CBS domain-containing protein [Planctomycetaceae bacterium]
QGRLQGVVPESAVIRGLMIGQQAPPTIQHLICCHVESVRLEAPLSAVLPLFRAACNSVIPAVDANGCVQGILTRRDVMQVMLEEAAQQTASPIENAALTGNPNSTSASADSPIRIDDAARMFSPRMPGADNTAGRASDARNDEQRPHFLRGEDALRKLRSTGSEPA